MNNAIEIKPAAGTAGQGIGTRGSVRYLDYTLINLLRQMPAGKKISMAELAEARGCSERELRARIEALRRAGYPILSSTAKGESGYWLGTSPEAIVRWKTQNIRRAVKVMDLARAVQLELFTDGNEPDRNL